MKACKDLLFVPLAQPYSVEDACVCRAFIKFRFLSCWRRRFVCHELWREVKRSGELLELLGAGSLDFCQKIFQIIIFSADFVRRFSEMKKTFQKKFCQI